MTCICCLFTGYSGSFSGTRIAVLQPHRTVSCCILYVGTMRGFCVDIVWTMCGSFLRSSMVEQQAVPDDTHRLSQRIGRSDLINQLVCDVKSCQHQRRPQTRISIALCRRLMKLRSESTWSLTQRLRVLGRSFHMSFNTKLEIRRAVGNRSCDGSYEDVVYTGGSKYGFEFSDISTSPSKLYSAACPLTAKQLANHPSSRRMAR